MLERTHHITKKRAAVFFVFLLSLVLLNCSTAFGLKTRRISSQTLRSMARIYMAFGEYEKAQPLVEQALTLANQKNDPDYECAMCLIDTACLYENQNKLASAEKMCEQGLRLQQEFLYENHQYIACTLRILSSIYRRQGKLRQAEDALEKAAAILRVDHTEDDYAMVSLEADIAKLLVAQGKLDEAENRYCHVLAVINKYDPDNFSKAGVLEDLAELYLTREKYDQADPLINQVLAMKEKIYGPKHHLLIQTLFTKAGIEREKGNFAQSEECIHKALATAEKTNNLTRIVQSQRRAQEIRSDKISTDKLLAKAVN